MNQHRILICGDRNWSNKKRLFDVMISIIRKHDTECIIEGEARGADLMGKEFAEYYRLLVHKYPADWTKFGRTAGMIRNKQMLDEGKPTMVIGFHNDISSSKGTKNMLDISKKAGIKTLIVTETTIEEYK